MIVRRNIEITGRLFTSDEDSLFDLPYIICVDAEQEFVVLYNPRNEYFHLDGYSIADGKMHHTFKFPRRCKIPPRTEYCVYTCPGAPNFDHGSLMEFHVLWTNHDGSLRKMEVLNNAYCDVKLITPDGNVISHCEAHKANPQAAQRLRYQTKQNSFAWRFGSALQSCLIYARIVALFGMAASAALSLPLWYVALYWTALLCDVFSRGKQERNPTLTTISLLGDRLSSLVLSLSLLHLFFTSHSAIGNTQDVSFNGTLGAVAWNNTGTRMVPGLSARTVMLALLLELGAVLLNTRHLLYPCPSSDVLAVSGLNLDPQSEAPLNPENEEENEDPSLDSTLGNSTIGDLYTVLQGLNGWVVTVLCVGAEYFLVHCYTSYHYQCETPLKTTWTYRFWVLAATIGCCAFVVRMLNHASLIVGAFTNTNSKA